MTKEYVSLGLMSGTSGDGIDASVIQSDGENDYKVILNEYFEYSPDIHQKIHSLKDKINNLKDLNSLSEELKQLEKTITLFHAKVANDILNESKQNIDLIGFHGQTIYHKAAEKISKQLGDGQLLSQLTKKNLIFNFRENDIKHGGEGAPLTPIFHKLLKEKFKIDNVAFINIGGIINETVFSNNIMSARDLGPGMCLIDQWIRKNSKKNFDIDGSIAKSGNINKIILNQSLENYYENLQNFNKDSNMSYDTNDFDLSFIRGLSFADGAATLVEFTAQIITTRFSKENKKIILCGGGRKNKYLVERIKKFHSDLKFIDDYGINGDFIESQAFAFLSIRSLLGLNISFPNTTGCKKSCTGGILVKY
jgi:anhydro-N-acetylmuramic acid kinase